MPDADILTAMSTQISYAARFLPLCFALLAFGTTSLEAVPAGTNLTPRAEVAPAVASARDQADQAVPDVPTEGGSVFYNRQFIASTMGRNRQFLLTFDDGPNPNTTPAILDTLRKHDLKAIFFVVGTNVRKYPEIVRRMRDEGHVIGNHTAHHANLAHAGTEKALEEIRALNTLVHQIAGVRPRVFRPPYGGLNQGVLQAVRQEGMDVMLWSVDPYDWRNRSVIRTCENVKRQLHLGSGGRGGVVLMHDTLPSTVAALEPLLVAFADNGLAPARYGAPVGGREYWAVKAPVTLEWVPEAPPLDLNRLNRPLMASLFKPPQDAFNWSPVALLKARKTGTLFESMLCRAFP